MSRSPYLHALDTPNTQEAPQAPVVKAGRYDHGQRRQAKRSGRETGCWAYIPAEELLKTGWDMDGPAPLYRVWGSSRGRVVIQLYKGQ